MGSGKFAVLSWSLKMQLTDDHPAQTQLEDKMHFPKMKDFVSGDLEMTNGSATAASGGASGQSVSAGGSNSSIAAV